MRLMLIDGSALMHRAFHGYPKISRQSDKLPVGAVHGFCHMTWPLVRKIIKNDITHVGMVFDNRRRRTFRQDLHPAYKANRSSLAADLISQLSLIQDATRAFSMLYVDQEGYEADDLIATYATQAIEAGGKAVIVTQDKDMMQLVCPEIYFFDPVQKKIVTTHEVVDKFGVEPDKVADVQALAGDPVDNIPGIPGIGIKSAAKLINEHGDLQKALTSAPGMPRSSKLRGKLIEYASDALVSKRLATLRRDVPVETPLDDLAFPGIDTDKLESFFRNMEAYSMITKLEKMS